MKVIIAGSRHMPVSMYPLISMAIERSHFEVSEVVCGMAAGADQLGGKWALENKIPVKCFPAKWNEHGKAAGPMRNKEMGMYADAAVIFIWDGSRGSANMLQVMKTLKKPAFVVWDGRIEEAF